MVARMDLGLRANDFRSQNTLNKSRSYVGHDLSFPAAALYLVLL